MDQIKTDFSEQHPPQFVEAICYNIPEDTDILIAAGNHQGSF